MELTRQEIADILRRTGLSQAADKALRELPDQVSPEHAAEWAGQYGITMDGLISRMGGGP